MELGCDRSKPLCEDGVCATMEETDRLSVAFDGHPSNDSVWGGFEDLDTHLLAELTAPTFHEEVHVIGDQAFFRHVAMIRVSLAVAHSLT